MSQLGQYTDRVDRWRGGSHLQRWAAAGLLAIEPHLKKTRGFRYLKLLRARLQEEIQKGRKKELLECVIAKDLGACEHLTTPQVEG